jgi:3',5'-cyclic AMP phosphodiesterase CpdA
MTLKSLLLRSFSIAAILIFAASCAIAQTPAAKPANEFSFVFMTDIHVQPEKNAEAGFRAAITKVNELRPEFVITGGDLVMDCLEQSYGRADTLYNIYTKMLKGFKMPVYNTIGNHEHYGWFANSGADTNNLEYGDKMFEKRIGPRYQRVDHKGWVFLLLDSVVKDGKGGYEGGVDSEQIQWLKSQLARISPETPIVVSVHIPLLTTEAQILRGATAANEPGEVIVNSREVTDLFKGHNLKLVLQGHLHYYETMYVFGTNYVTGGSVAASWWEGPYLGTEEGFVLLKVKNNDVSWEYVDYGWNIK